MKKVLALIVLSALFVTLTVSCNREDASIKEQKRVEGMALSDNSGDKGIGGVYPDADKVNDSNKEINKEEISEGTFKVYYYDPAEDYIVYEKAEYNKKENNVAYFFEKYFKFAPKRTLVANMPGSTKINSINFYPDKELVVMDVSENFTQLMNIGGGVESSIIQCIANTLCEAYGGTRLIITTNGEDYQGSHLEISPMNSIAINTKGTKEIVN